MLAAAAREVLAARSGEAREALERALVGWERKRCVPFARRTREQIEPLERTFGPTIAADSASPLACAWMCTLCFYV